MEPPSKDRRKKSKKQIFDMKTLKSLPFGIGDFSPATTTAADDDRSIVRGGISLHSGPKLASSLHSGPKLSQKAAEVAHYSMIKKVYAGRSSSDTWSKRIR